MLRIVGINRSDRPQSEFVLLQNQGSMRVRLRGHLIVAESAIERGDLACGAFAFRDEETLPPGFYIQLITGRGEPHWAKSRDGAYLYVTFACLKTPLWHRCEGALHLLSLSHSFAERGELLMLR